MDRSERATMQELMRRLEEAGRSGPAGACPDENLLVGLVEDTLLEEESEQLVYHLARCKSCRGILARDAGTTVTNGAPPADSPVRSSSSSTTVRSLAGPGRLLAAAALLIAATWFLGRGFLASDTVEGTVEEQLFAAAHSLALSRPELFGEFQPLHQDERVNPGSTPMRGTGLVLLRPFRKVLDKRPKLVWEAGADRYRVRLFTDDGTPLWALETEVSSQDFPPGEPDLEEGVGYLWEVVADGPFGETRASRVFEVAGQELQSRFAAALGEIDSTVPVAIRDLVKSHLALRENLLGEAEQFARAHLRQDPSDRVGRETLYHILAQLGAPGADDLLGQIEAGN